MSSSSQALVVRKSRGRQKVRMVKMSNEANLQVTFSKRRAGLFKKASELCTLCGSEASIVVFSPANKVFCFGHPSVQTVIDKFEQLNFSQTQAPGPPTTAYNSNTRSQVLLEAHRNSNIRELNLELTQVEGLLRGERRCAEELEVLRKMGEMEGWFFPSSFDGLNLEQLSVLKESIMGFKRDLDVKVRNDMYALANPPPPPPPSYYLPPPSRGNMVLHNNNNSSNNGQLSLGTGCNDLISPSYNHEPVGLLGGYDQGATNNNVYGSIDEAESDPLSCIVNGMVHRDRYQNGGGDITSIVSSSQGFNNMGFDPARLF